MTHRIYRPDDLHTAGIVVLGRAYVVKQLLIKEYPDLDSSMVRYLVDGALFYATCDEDMFTQLENSLK